MAATEPHKTQRGTTPVQRAEPEPHKGTPTPTQAENDAAALGQHEPPLDDDGSGPDPNSIEGKEEQLKVDQQRLEKEKTAREAATKDREAAAAHRESATRDMAQANKPAGQDYSTRDQRAARTPGAPSTTTKHE